MGCPLHYVTALERITAGINKAEDACLTAVGCLYLGENFEYCGRFGASYNCLRLGQGDCRA